MKNRFSRLLQPGSILAIALLIVGTNLGISYGLNNFKAKLRAEYNVPAEEWEKFSGNVWTMQFDITLTVLVMYALAVLLAPEPQRGERAALRQLAKQKLSQSVLSESETLFWSQVLNEVKNDAETH